MSFQRPFLISLKRESEQPWGFRLVGGKDKDEPHFVQKIAPGGLAETCGLREGDELIQIGRINVQDLSHGQVEDVILKCRNRLEMFVIREDIFQPRKGQNEPQSIKAVVHAQYNSPMGLYSSQNIADTLGQTAEYALGDADQRKAPSQPLPSYDDYQRHVSFTQLQPTSPQNYAPLQRVPTPVQPLAHPSPQAQQYPSNVVMNNTQPYRTTSQMHDNRVTTSYYQQQQPSYDRHVATGYTQQQFQNKTSVQRVEHQTQQQRYEREHPQVSQTLKKVEFSHQPTVAEERRVAFADHSQKMEKQMHQHMIQQEREYTQRPQSPKPMLHTEHHRMIQNEREQRPQSPRATQQMHRHVIQNGQEYAKRPQSPKSILRSEQHREREHHQRPQSPRPMMRTEEEDEYQRRPVQERAAAYQEMVQTQEQVNVSEQRAPHKGTPYERQVSTSTVQLKQVPSPTADKRSDHQMHQRPQSPRPMMRTDEDIYQRKAVQERATAYQDRVHNHEQVHVSEQRAQHRGTPYERQVSTSTVQLKQVSSPTPDTRIDHQQRPHHPPSQRVSTRPVMHTSPSPTISPATTPNTTRKRMEGVWPPKASNVKPMPKTGFNTTSTGKQLTWPPSPKNGWESDGSWPPSGRQTPQSPTLSRKMVNAWNPSPSPPPMRRAVASPVTARRAIWPPPSRSPEKATHFQPINKPHRKTGKFDDYIQHHASCGVPATYRPPPSVQHIEVNY